MPFNNIYLTLSLLPIKVGRANRRAYRHITFFAGSVPAHHFHQFYPPPTYSAYLTTFLYSHNILCEAIDMTGHGLSKKVPANRKSAARKERKRAYREAAGGCHRHAR